MDHLHRHIFTVLMDREWAHGVAATVDVTLLSRFYERFADHAVQIGRRVIFQATGQTGRPRRSATPVAAMTTRPLDHRRASTGSGASEVARAPAGGTPQRVGGFRFYFADDRWEWSEPVQPMHGYEPGTVAPTTEPLLSHKHPEDYDQIAATIEKIRRTGKPLEHATPHHRRQGQLT